MVYNNTGGDDWMINTLWNNESPVCEYIGIKCNEEDNIIGLILQNNGLTSTPTKELFLLLHLQILNLEGNPLEFYFEGIEEAKG